MEPGMIVLYIMIIILILYFVWGGIYFGFRQAFVTTRPLLRLRILEMMMDRGRIPRNQAIDYYNFIKNDKNMSIKEWRFIVCMIQK